MLRGINLVRRNRSAMRTIKKYSNRRLYDTEVSGYITLDELAETIRRGVDVKVVDAKSGEDLTQGTLAQIVVETGAARLLPAPLLTQMIRMGDDALAEFMQLYVAWAFQVYAETKKGLGKLPGIKSIDGDGAVAKLLNLNPFYRAAKAAAAPPSGRRPAPEPLEEESEPEQTDVAELRREMDELKAMIAKLAESK